METTRILFNTNRMEIGKPYPTDEWLTVKEYCKRFKITNTQTVSNWISRGIIPAENVLIVEEYNNIRLIKALPYHH
ncbi:hypothetical protein [Dyadobacter bucti]|uniref:hypothetical protein n=1 Tax=Dyadobacter bucti TaxID=2572203 RepID=UPI003F713CC9